MDDQYYMENAYQEALRAFDEGEVPVGSVIVHNERIIGKGYNRIEALQDGTAHAEILAITAASESRKTWRLNECTLYVTLEPCLMCLGAIMQSRIETIVYGAPDRRMGAIDSFSYKNVIFEAYRRFPPIRSGIMAQESIQLLRSFFSELRKKK